MTSTASTTSMASMTSTSSFHQNFYWSWRLDHPWHPNDQYRPLFMEWIIKIPFFHWYMIPSLSEAVEASRCYFFKNRLKKLKCPNFLKPLAAIIQKKIDPRFSKEKEKLTRTLAERISLGTRSKDKDRIAPSHLSNRWWRLSNIIHTLQSADATRPL